MKRKDGEKAGIVLTIIVCLVFMPIIIINSTLIIKTYTDKNHLPSIFGVKPVVVLSGSMSPVFEKNDLIFIKNADVNSLKVGDIICYLTNTNNGKVAITHKINEIKMVDGNIEYVTKGDANNTVDKLTVKQSQVEGIYSKKITGLGSAAMFMQSTTGMIIFIVCPIVLYLIWDIVRRSKDSKKEKEENKKLKEEIEKLKNSK